MPIASGAMTIALLAAQPVSAAIAASPGEPSELARAVTTACLEALGQRPHGLASVSAEGKAVLCVRGEIGLSNAQVKAADFVKAGKDHAAKLDGIFFTSPGGQAEPWLEFAERIGQVDFVIVGGLCNSGCANYGFVLGRRKIVMPGSIVGWHGGPTGDPAVAKRFMKRVPAGRPFISGVIVGNQPGNPVGRLFFRSNTAAKFLKIGRRTELLYRRLGISTRVLSDTTGARPPEAIVDEVLRRHRPEEISSWVVLFPPEVLVRCYGFSGLEEMWHPGGPEATMNFGLQPNLMTGLVTTTRDVGADGCPAAPAEG